MILLNPSLAGLEDSCSDSDRDREGRELFELYRQCHPRKDLVRFESKFKSIGDLDFLDTMRDYLQVFERGVEKSENEVLGFGKWRGEVENNVKKCLGVRHCFVSLSRCE